MSTRSSLDSTAVAFPTSHYYADFASTSEISGSETRRVNRREPDKIQSDIITSEMTRTDNELLSIISQTLHQVLAELRSNRTVTYSDSAITKSNIEERLANQAESTTSSNEGGEIELSESRKANVAAGRMTFEEAKDLQRFSNFKSKCTKFQDELNDTAIAFSSVGGTRAIVEALNETAREVLVYDVKWVYRPNDIEIWKRTKEQFERLERARDAFTTAMWDIKETRPYRYEAITAWGEFMNMSISRINEALLSMGNVDSDAESDEGDALSKYFIDRFPDDFDRHASSVMEELVDIREKGVDRMRKAEQNDVQRYSSMTTVATFFSGVTATTLQFSFTQTDTSLNRAVNLFWFCSLVLSIASAINSLLGLTWRKSSIPQQYREWEKVQNFTPRSVSFWLDKAPMVFLVLSAFTFVVGLVLFSYASQQGALVSVFTTTLVLLHVLALAFVTLIFLLELKKRYFVSEKLSRMEHWVEIRTKNLRHNPTEALKAHVLYLLLFRIRPEVPDIRPYVQFGDPIPIELRAKLENLRWIPFEFLKQLLPGLYRHHRAPASTSDDHELGTSNGVSPARTPIRNEGSGHAGHVLAAQTTASPKSVRFSVPEPKSDALTGDSRERVTPLRFSEHKPPDQNHGNLVEGTEGLDHGSVVESGTNQNMLSNQSGSSRVAGAYSSRTQFRGDGFSQGLESTEPDIFLGGKMAGSPMASNAPAEPVGSMHDSVRIYDSDVNPLGALAEISIRQQHSEAEPDDASSPPDSRLRVKLEGSEAP